MPTKAEEARAKAERSANPPRPPRVRVPKGSQARVEAARQTSGRDAGGVTARRNVKHGGDRRATHDLEDSATGRPSRKLTRKGANRAKPDSQLRRRAIRQARSPKTRASARA